MSALEVAIIAVVAVLGFWCLGAYNRLVGLRNAIGAAWAPIEAALARRHELTAALLVGLRRDLGDEHALLDSLLAASVQVRACADAVRARASAAEPLASLALAEGVYRAAAARLVDLVGQHPDVAAQSDIAGTLAELRELDTRLAFARQWFNDSASNYDAAVRQYPTRWLAGLFGFARAGRL